MCGLKQWERRVRTRIEYKEGSVFKITTETSIENGVCTIIESTFKDGKLGLEHYSSLYNM